MSITRVGGTADTQSGTDLNLNWASVGTPQANDLALLFWNGMSGLTWGGSNVAFALLNAKVSNSGSHEGRLYYRVLSGSESGTWTFTQSAINKQTAVMEVYRGVDTSAPISDWDLYDETLTSTSHACPQVTTVTADEAIIAAIMERFTGSSTNYTAPTGYTKRQQPTPVGGGGSTSLAVADDGFAVSRAAGTNVTPPNWTNGASTDNVMTWTLALAPAVVTPTGDAAPPLRRPQLHNLLIR